MGTLLLLAPDDVITSPVTIWLVWWVLYLFARRHPYGQDGADQMLLLIFTASAVVSLSRTPATTAMALWAIGIQCSLAYFVAGAAKLSAAGWRNGHYLPGIFGTQIYGMPPLSRLLAATPPLAVGLSWLVIGFECLFPLAFVLPWPWGAALLGGGLIFHASNAVFMGLGSFLAVFVSSYPALLYCLSHKGW
jgi:hypothetical protein